MHYFFKADIEYYDDEDNTLHLDPNQHYYFLEPHEDKVNEYYDDSLRANNREYYKHKKRYGLADYIHEDEGDIYSKVVCIDYKIEKGYCIFTVVAEKELSENDINCLIKYLNGQISDGWGENGHWISNRYDDHTFVWVKENTKEVFQHPFDDHDYVDTWEEVERIMYERLKKYEESK